MPSNFTEMKIPVPYGYIAAKVWGSLNENSIRVIAMHGYMDNAGTFDRLIPLLPDQFYVVAIDLPGHGFSSHVPYGTPYDDNTWSLAVRHVLDFLRFDKFTILGHSMGASIGWFYASVCPSQVERIIAIDQIKPLGCKDAREAADLYGQALTSYLEAEKKYKQPQPSFRFENALEILIIAHDAFGVELNREGALCLLKRATKTSPDGSGLTFTRDARLNALLGHKTDAKTLREFYSKMTCEMLIILGKDGINDFKNPDIKMVHDGHAETAKNFKCVTIDGDHFIHLTEPEKVAKIITDYVMGSDLTKKIADLSV